MERWQVTRRDVLVAGIAVGVPAGHGLFPTRVNAQTILPAEREPDPLSSFPQQPPALVRETVGASHGRFDRVRELVTACPELAKSCWDWGFGDWESPVEAAAHTGNRDIAKFLIDRGARPNLFTFAMLGQLDVVRALLAAQPGLRDATGPHGLSLWHHAQVGGEHAVSVRDYLESLGLSDEGVAPLSADQAEPFLGRYEERTPPTRRFEVLLNQRGLAVKCNGGPPRSLVGVGENTFHPAGADSVIFQFRRSGPNCEAVTVALNGTSMQAVSQ